MSSRKVILVTGASGYLGANVVDQALKAGHKVRGTARSAKAAEMRKNNPHPDFEVVIVDDLENGDFTEAFKGVDAIFHVASPMVGKGGYTAGVNGTKNLLRQAYECKIYKITIVGSFYAVFSGHDQLWDRSRHFTDQDWGHASEELLFDADHWAAYPASKVLSERAVWEFVDAHPEMDVIMLLPAYLHGPLASSHVTKDKSMLSSSNLVYMMLAGPNADWPPQIPPQIVDVRDVARACTLSLDSKPPKIGQHRRILLWGGSVTWKEAARHIGIIRPDLKERLIERGEAVAENIPSATLDRENAKDILGLGKFIPWQKTMEDSVTSLLEREKTWVN